jgi:hypothetical protein
MIIGIFLIPFFSFCKVNIVFLSENFPPPNSSNKKKTHCVFKFNRRFTKNDPLLHTFNPVPVTVQSLISRQGGVISAHIFLKLFGGKYLSFTVKLLYSYAIDQLENALEPFYLIWHGHENRYIYDGNLLCRGMAQPSSTIAHQTNVIPEIKFTNEIIMLYL